MDFDFRSLVDTFGVEVTLWVVPKDTSSNLETQEDWDNAVSHTIIGAPMGVEGADEYMDAGVSDEADRVMFTHFPLETPSGDIVKDNSDNQVKIKRSADDLAFRVEYRNEMYDIEGELGSYERAGFKAWELIKVRS